LKLHLKCILFIITSESFCESNVAYHIGGILIEIHSHIYSTSCHMGSYLNKNLADGTCILFLQFTHTITLINCTHTHTVMKNNIYNLLHCRLLYQQKLCIQVLPDHKGLYHLYRKGKIEKAITLTKDDFYISKVTPKLYCVSPC